MAAEETAAPVAAPAVAAPAEGDKPKAGSGELLRMHAERTQREVARELADADAEVVNGDDTLNAAIEDAKKPGTERDEKGKFMPKAEAAPKVPEKAAAPVTADSVSKLQRLVSDGKIAEALQALGLDEKGLSGKNWEAFRRDNAKARAVLERQKAEASQAYQHVERVAGQLEQQYGRYRAAEQAFRAEDFEGAFQAAFGLGLNEFQQKAIQRLANKDPEVARLRAELRAKDEQRAAYEAQQRQAYEAAQVEQQRSEYVAGISKELTELDDPRIPRAAGRKDFVARVFNQQAKHYDARSDSTISTREAAELALAELEQEYAGLRTVFDGDGGAVKPARSASGSNLGGRNPSRPVSPARQTNLRSQEAAEASSPGPKLTGKELLQYHVRKTLAAAERERGGSARE